MAKPRDLTGKKINRLTIVSRVGTDSKRCATWLCLCDCGNNAVVASRHLKPRGTQSCGCVRNEAKSTHGECLSGNRRTKEYIAWTAMKQRCTDPKYIKYKDYGGRGIIVCKRWLNSFESFLADMGRAPSPNHSIDRKNNHGNYEPGNCRWATRIEQANNQRSNIVLSFNGKTQTIKQWSNELFINYSTLHGRLKRGMPIDKCLTTNYK